MESTLLFIGNIGMGELFLLLLILGIPGILWIWAVVDLLSSKFANRTEKLIWLIVIAFLPFIGAILYLIIGRRQKIKPSNNWDQL
ncbi:PLD nuclease N-terminal domain-containing protein [Rufibacter ruber]|uniref:PLD nuclease N-terminal domain-containing protein n=1 Tax=Rufibacter ruber TaxID=1783499 RepID=UPI00082D4591|nr:PLD nuclease N-terminal domain-containing protein [Rufibacter ruber]